jgi:hypothetical protein
VCNLQAMNGALVPFPCGNSGLDLEATSTFPFSCREK